MSLNTFPLILCGIFIASCSVLCVCVYLSAQDLYRALFDTDSKKVEIICLNILSLISCCCFSVHYFVITFHCQYSLTGCLLSSRQSSEFTDEVAYLVDWSSLFPRFLT